jgi:toxin FitB
VLLLDTNVLSSLRRPERADPALLAFASGSIGENAFVSAVSIMEIEYGALLLARRDRLQSAMLMEWLERTLLPEYSGRILDVTLAVARRCAALHVPNPQAYRDAFIAATALAHGLTLVTRNIKDFAATGVKLLNPWEL